MPVEIYPVVHITDGTDAEELSTQQARLAAEHGAKGLFLIDHHSSEVEMLLRCFNAASEALPDLYLGINFLQLSSAYDSFQQLLEWKTTDRISKMPNGLWVDAAHNLPQKTVELRRSNPELQAVQYLGGVAFKYTSRFTDDPSEAAAQAEMFKSYVDVVTTSGPGTGMPANPDKISLMKQEIGDQPLALASGVDVNNIHLYKAADIILVSSSIETHPQSGELNGPVLEELIDAASAL